jgi:hypothetical protein
MAGCPASSGHRPRCAAHGGRGRGDQAVGRAVAGDGGPSGQAPVQPYRRRGVRAARRRCSRAGSDRAVPVDCGMDLLRRRGAFLPAGLDAGQPVVAAAGGVAGGCGCGGAGSWAGIGDGPIDGHWCRGWVVPPRLRRRYLPDRRKGTCRRLSWRMHGRYDDGRTGLCHMYDASTTLALRSQISTP